MPQAVSISKVAERTDILSKIGNTPLIRLARITEHLPGIEIYAKAEYFNPGGSVKDRPALHMILEGERTGQLTRDRIILDATSGNTGIAYAMIAAVKGYRVRLCLPSNASLERKRILTAYGAEVFLTDPAEGSDGAIRKCREIYEADPDRYFYPDQYNNDANWRAHYDTTAAEIIEQTSGRLTHFVVGLGTSGTFVGTGRRLRKFNPSIKLISFQPNSPFHGLEGLKHMDSAIVPGIYDPSLADEDLRISTERAHVLVRRLAREMGLMAGVSSGAALAAVLEVAQRLDRGIIVTVFPDGAEKYLNETFWDAEDNAV